MRRFLILFIIAVSIMTFMFTRSRTETFQGYSVSEEAAENYKQTMIKKYNTTEAEAEKSKNDFIKSSTIEPSERVVEGMSFIEALKFSSFLFVLVYGIFFIIFHVKNAYYNEMFGTYGGNPNDPLRGWRRFFFGKWF